MKQLSSLAPFLICCILISSASAQKTYYVGVEIPIKVPPAYPQYKEYRTYDLSMISFVAPEDKSLKKYEELPYEIKLGDLKKSNNGDMHVVASLSGFVTRLTSKSNATGFVSLRVSVYDRNGNKLKSARLHRENFNMSLGRKFTDEEIKNSDLVSTVIIQNAIDTALQSFNLSFSGSVIKPEFMLGALKDVKDKPELKEFSKQPDEIYKAVQTNNPAELKIVLDNYLPYWEKMAAYAGEGEVNEVKRAAYQNLIVYYTVAGNTQKAKEYIAQYKPIDKIVSAAFGLYKVKYSEQCEQRLNEFFPSFTTANQSSVPVTIAELIDREQYLTLSGNIKLGGKRKAGDYSGVIKITKISLPAGAPGYKAPDKPGDDVFITTSDGQNFSITSSDIIQVKVNENELYTAKVFGAMMGVGGALVIMKSSYISPRITVYRSYFPDGDDYFIVKAGDTEGLTQSPFKARKKLAEYLSDCPDLSQKLKDKVISEDEREENIAQLYTECK